MKLIPGFVLFVTNTMGTTCKDESVYPSGAHDIIQVNGGVSFTQFLFFYDVFCRLLFVY